MPLCGKEGKPQTGMWISGWKEMAPGGMTCDAQETKGSRVSLEPQS